MDELKEAIREEVAVEQQAGSGPQRRNVLTGLATAGIGVPLLAACGSSGSGSAAGGLAQRQASQSTSGAPNLPTSNLTSLVKAADVPVGEGVIVAQAVVTQPTAGEFKAFSPICTHQGCTVTQVVNKQIICPCHNSAFSIVDGSVQGGPAPSPLPAIDVVNKNGEIYAT